MISTRSRASLCQYLELQQPDRTALILNKHGIETPEPETQWGRPQITNIGKIQQWLADASQQSIEHVLVEIARTQSSLYIQRTSNVATYRERYQDLLACLGLDGYIVEDGALRRVEPTLDGEVVEDDLTQELQRSGLAKALGVLQLLTNSAEDFRGVPADLNGALANARVALQTLATAISRERANSSSAGFNETKWGQVITHLRTSGLITTEEEKGLAGVFNFVSPGAHTIVGLSETEMVRLGRSLVVSMCYFLVKRWNGRER